MPRRNCVSGLSSAAPARLKHRCTPDPLDPTEDRVTNSTKLVPLLLFGMMVPTPAQSQQAAQAAPPTIILSKLKCDMARMGEILSQAELQLPYWQEQKVAGN
jgi:hypothetical protein